jgi:hypothetical protein
MDDMIDDAMHKDHEKRLSDQESMTQVMANDIDGLKSGVAKILEIIQDNQKESRPSLALWGVGIGLLATFGIGFMNLIIMPMKEDTSQHEASFSDLTDKVYSQEIESARVQGETKGKLDAMAAQVNSIDKDGPRSK